MTLSTHVLDTTLGRPAAEVEVELLFSEEHGWRGLNRTRTDHNGRVSNLAGDDTPLAPGTYRLVFDTATYFLRVRQHGFYPEVVVTISITDAQVHYHVPLLLSPFAYSTYRGS